MKEAMHTDDMNVKEALERLSLPGFFSEEERLQAYFVIFQNGNPVQKVLAEKTVERFPLSEKVFTQAA